jgi:putative membrane protein
MNGIRKATWFWRSVWPPLPVWRRLDFTVFAVAVYFIGVGFVFELTDLHMPKWGGVLTLLNAVVLGVLLQFRNRESYDRWWEARRLWGQLVNDSRNLCVKVASLPRIVPRDRAEAGRLVVEFAVAMKNRLRLPTGRAMPSNIPLEYALQTALLVRQWRESGKISDWDLLLLDPHVRAQSDILGACERIKYTPLPLSYRSLLRHGLVLYLFTCPWLIFEDVHWWGLPAIGLLTYFLMGIEYTAEDVEEPFGRDDDDLALNTYCETIWKSAREVLAVDLTAPALTVEMRI